MKERDYQIAAVDSIFNWFTENDTNPLIAMPTGTGKSIVIASFLKRMFAEFPNQRVIKLTHVKELIAQNFDKLMRIWPTAPAGIYSAGLKRRDINRKIIFGGIASVIKNATLFGHIDLVIIDEAHMVSPKDKTRYHKFINDLKKVNPHVKVIGLTATPFRLGQGMLTHGKEPLFGGICFDLCSREAFNWMIDNGYLCRLVPRPTETIYDLSKVSTVGGDYNQQQLAQVMDQDYLTRRAVLETMRVGKDRKSWLVFASGINHAINTTRILNEYGVKAVCIHSKMSSEERDNNISKYLSGHYSAMVNNGILTTGFDHPALDLIVMLRATKSAQLWVQMLGRGARPCFIEGYDLETVDGRLSSIYFSDKKDCLVLDFAGNALRLGPINDPVLPKHKSKKDGSCPVKLCPACNTYNHSRARFCEFCKYEFPVCFDLDLEASNANLVAPDKPDQPAIVYDVFNVSLIQYRTHQKTGSPPSMLVSYYVNNGLRMFKKWICFEHPGVAGRKAKEWWAIHSDAEPPETVEQALQRTNELKQPKTIKVWINTKYPEIVSYEFSTNMADGKPTISS